ncbi:PH domain-containing protein [Brevibacterium antiquum]|uniref:PH domain-containing protein n=1 Tax=Brevibacterium antiquum TaxID=234835 RepID=A0A2H1KHE9_9MICO|nr:PH domain-containing protein [Brevibacterium antiquum]SMX99190.1 PH domain-containing protein [Brevibacterium antiquum]
MSTDLQTSAAWTFTSERPIPDDLGPLLVPGETPVTAFKTIRGSAIYTNKRLIIRDSQGMTGKKIEIDKGLDVRRLDHLIAQAVIG